MINFAAAKGGTAARATPEALRWKVAPLSRSPNWTDQWDEFNCTNWDTPLLSTRMLQPALSRFGRGNESLARAIRGGRVVAMAVIRPISAIGWESFAVPQLPLSALITTDRGEVESVGASLLAALPASAMTLSLENLDSRLLDRPTETSWLAVVPHLITGAIDFPNVGSDYFAARPTSLRQNVSRRMRRAEADVGAPRLRVLTSEESVERFIEIYSSTESSGWKGSAGTAVGTEDPQGAFYRDVLTSFARTGEARMFVLSFGDVDVAQQMAIEHAGVLYLLKTTYDEAYKPYAPGVLQRMLVAQWAAGQRKPIRRIEFYGRVGEWQRPFVNDSRAIYHATFYRYAAVRNFRDALRRLQSAVKWLPRDPSSK